MDKEISILKGIHPGLFLDRELKKRKLARGKFALQLGEYPQLIGEITKGKRRLTPRVALKLDDALGKEEGFFLVLQALHDASEERKKSQPTHRPDVSRFRPSVFWDTDIQKLDWQECKPGMVAGFVDPLEIQHQLVMSLGVDGRMGGKQLG
ncbi:transcriptional regulator [Parapedobacter sp. GCM10030251]|uniref:helix-turn-helix transcriptional regulator n=1 Tax=Parapedobacter sp. GCM10030251 TaxID=3273419 RepID=UPI003615F7BB